VHDGAWREVRIVVQPHLALDTVARRLQRRVVARDERQQRGDRRAVEVIDEVVT
jgi:hypothetical protein